MKKIKDLIDCNYDIDILGITDDSRNVKKGFLFVATSGFNVDHYDYIGDAIENGCSFVICDRKIDYDIPYIIVDDINNEYLELCKKFYEINFEDYFFIGITGTDGKTTTSTIVKRLLNNISKTTYIGTNGAEVGVEKYTVSNTTPCISELYNILNISKNKDATDIVMEVSSEALLHDRVKNIKYNIVGFTNITEDHLNVHKTIDNYVSCKLKLLDLVDDNGIVIVNGDDKYCKNINFNNIVKFGFDSSNDCIISNVIEDRNRTIFEISYLGNSYKINSPYTGIYNVYNITMAFLICYYHGLSPEYLIDAIYSLESVSGRRELLDFGQDFEIILDYAHTLNGIKNVVESVDKSKEIIVVTGCAGGREKSKRTLIGSYLLNNVSKCIFTMDDPRYESVDDIIDDMVSCNKNEYIRIIDRKDAIYKAFDIASKNSVVLILGKGRDNYMAIDDKKIPYCDYDVISGYFNQ